MKQHKYRITLEHLSNPKGEVLGYSPLQFEVGNHDDIFKIVELMRSRGDLKENDATAFALGLKLFSEVMLENKQNPLFASFKNDFGKFMKELKAGVKKA
jgi:hypothetical protein